jgi:transposase
MAKYSTEFKLTVVQYVLNDGLSANEASSKFGVHRGDVQKWVAVYQSHGVSGIERKRVSYPGEFKQAVIEDMRTNGLSMRATAAKYNLCDHNLVAKWERIYLEEGAPGLYVERRGRKTGLKSECRLKLLNASEEDLIAENQRLRMEIEYLKKLNALVRERELSEKRKKLR